MPHSSSIITEVGKTIIYSSVDLSICRFPAGYGLPKWLDLLKPFFTITRSDEELSVICHTSAVPETASEHGDISGGWRRFHFRGPLDEVTRASCHAVRHTLTDKDIQCTCLSSHDTEHILVKKDQVDQAYQLLEQDFTIIKNISL